MANSRTTAHETPVSRIDPMSIPVTRKKITLVEVCFCTPIIPALRRKKQEDMDSPPAWAPEFKANLNHIVKTCPREDRHRQNWYAHFSDITWFRRLWVHQEEEHAPSVPLSLPPSLHLSFTNIILLLSTTLLLATSETSLALRTHWWNTSFENHLLKGREKEVESVHWNIMKEEYRVSATPFHVSPSFPMSWHSYTLPLRNTTYQADVMALWVETLATQPCQPEVKPQNSWWRRTGP